MRARHRTVPRPATGRQYPRTRHRSHRRCSPSWRILRFWRGLCSQFGSDLQSRGPEDVCGIHRGVRWHDIFDFSWGNATCRGCPEQSFGQAPVRESAGIQHFCDHLHAPADGLCSGESGGTSFFCRVFSSEKGIAGLRGASAEILYTALAGVRVAACVREGAGIRIPPCGAASETLRWRQGGF